MPKANYIESYKVNISGCTKTNSLHVAYFYELLRITRKVIFSKHSQEQKMARQRYWQKAHTKG